MPIPLPPMSAGGNISPDLSSSSASGDIYTTTNATQGGLTINKGIVLPDWVKGVGVIGLVTVSGVYLWKKK